MKFSIRISYFCLFVICLSACSVPHETLINFSKDEPFPSQIVKIPSLSPITIQPGDILVISVHTLDQSVAAPYNLGNAESNSSSTTPGEYLVRKDSTISYPGVGDISVGGKTIQQITANFQELLSPYLTDPTIRVQLKNIKFAVFGAVGKAAYFTLEQERISILEALSMAGDVTPYGNRTNILVIREQGNTRSFGHINLQSREVFNSPYFYISKNDVIYVEPTKYITGTVRTPLQNTLPWVSALTSFTALVITILR